MADLAVLGLTVGLEDFKNIFQLGQFYNSKLVFWSWFKTLTKLNICAQFLSAVWLFKLKCFFAFQALCPSSLTDALDLSSLGAPLQSNKVQNLQNYLLPPIPAFSHQWDAPSSSVW